MQKTAEIQDISNACIERVREKFEKVLLYWNKIIEKGCKYCKKELLDFYYCELNNETEKEKVIKE